MTSRNCRRGLSALIAVAAVTLLAGCVAYPAYPGYGYYGGPYYGGGVVAYGGGWHDHWHGGYYYR